MAVQQSRLHEAIQILRHLAADASALLPSERRQVAHELRSIADTFIQDEVTVTGSQILIQEEVTLDNSSANDTRVSEVSEALSSKSVQELEENDAPQLQASCSASPTLVEKEHAASPDKQSGFDAELHSEISTWKVPQLKQALDECGVQRRDLLEKKELVDALSQALHKDPSLRLRVITMCQICCRTLPTETFWPLACKHLPCETCLGRHLAVEAEKMQKNARRHEIPCLYPDCKVPIPLSTATEFCKRVRGLWENLGMREKLTKDAKYKIAECPQQGCVGIAYLEPGRSTAMCFICEHQWKVSDASEDTSHRPEFSSGVRKCPKCQAPIERSFGCDHMECAKCGRAFDWSRADFANDEHNRSSSSSSNRAGATGQPPDFNFRQFERDFHQFGHDFGQHFGQHFGQRFVPQADFYAQNVFNGQPGFQTQGQNPFNGQPGFPTQGPGFQTQGQHSFNRQPGFHTQFHREGECAIS